MKKICLCAYCIEGLRSRGEKIFVSDITHYDSICNWCGVEDDVYECLMAE